MTDPSDTSATQALSRSSRARRWCRVNARLVTLGLAAAAAVLILMFTVVIPAFADRPIDVVEDYLAALLDKDVEGALQIANTEAKTEQELEDESGEGYEYEYDDQSTVLDESLLTAEALSGDWTVTSLMPHNHSDTGSVVYATIAGANGDSTAGRFDLTATDDGWRIDNPFVEYQLPVHTLGHLEFNGIPVPGSDEDTDGTMTAPTLALFPGQYQPYADSAALESGKPDGLLLLPDNQRQLTPLELTVTDEGARVVQQDFEAYLDDCADQDVPSPQGCPFNAHDSYHDSLYTDKERYESLEELVWEVEYPKIRLRADIEGFTIVTVEAGTVHLTGSGVPKYADDAERTDFSVDCSIDTSVTRTGYTAEGEFTFAADAGYLSGDCRE